MATRVVDLPHRDALARRAGGTLSRSADRQKQVAKARGVSEQRISQECRGEYPQTLGAYQTIAALAKHDRTKAEVIVQDLHQLAAEVAFGDLDTPALYRELAIRAGAIQAGAVAMTEVAGILALLREQVGESAR